MRLPPLRSPVFPISGPRWDIVVASVFMVVTTASLVSAKTLAFTGAIFIAVLAFTQAARGKLSLDLLKPSWNTLPIIGLIAYAFITLLWAPEASASVLKLVTVALIVLAAVFTVRTIAAEPAPNTARLGESLWIGVTAGLLYLIVRNVTAGSADSAVIPRIMHKLIKFDISEMARSIAPVTLLIGPALLAISAGILKPWRAVFSLLLIIAAVLAIATSPHETSKLALVAWFIVFGVAYVADRISYRMVQAAWIAACLLVVPASILGKERDLHNARWLQSTAQHRILIWHHFAGMSLKRPIFGHGFDMAAITHPEVAGVAELRYTQRGRPVPAKVKPFQAIHPHNAFLQIWYELGAVGIALFLAMGMTAINGIAELKPHQRPYIYATAAAATVMLFSSYGLWQIWLIGLLGFTAIACTVAIRLSSLPDGGADGRAAMS